MIDTIRGNLEIPFKMEALREAPENWEYQRNRKTDVKGSKTTHLFYHKPTGLRLHGKTWMNSQEYIREPKYQDGEAICTSVEVAMPRLVHDSNGILLSNEQELEEAYSCLKYLMRQILEYDQTPELTRVDLVWQFRGDMQDWINSFRQVTHPNIRGGQIIYEGETIQWKGHRLDICIYDKLREKKINFKRGQGVVRAEVRLRNQKKEIAKLTKPVLGGREIDFDKAYNRFRIELTKLEGKKLPSYGMKGAYAALAMAKAHGMTSPDGVPLVDIARQGLTRQGQHKMLKKLNDLVQKHKMVSFRKLLPVTHHPEVVNVYPKHEVKDEQVKVA